MDTYVAKVQIGNNVNDLSPIASTMFGICNSSITATTKVVTFSKFDKLINGVTVFVRFTNGNSLPGNLKLQVGATLAYDITGDCICGENEIIAFTFEEVDANHKYWRANSSGITAAMKEFIINTINTSTDTPDVLIMKGTIGAGGNPGYIPASGYETGWTYRVVTAGTYLGQKCEVGDLIIAIENASSSQGSVNNNHWIIIQSKMQDVVINSTGSVASHVAIFTDNTGKEIEDSGFTISKSVPADAKFTDTTYTNGTGLDLDENVFSVKYGTTAGTAAAGDDARFSALAPITHTHGNIANDGTLGTANALLKTDNNKEITIGPLLGNDTSKFLDNTGAWATPPVTSVNNQTGDVVIDLSDLNLNIDAMHFIGQATVEIVPDTSMDPHITGYTWATDRQAGDVILGKTDGREYVLDSSDSWILLGQDASTTFNSDNLSVDTSRTSNIWVAQIEQSSDRRITATMGELDTSGTWTGNAGSATKLETARSLVVDLETPSGTLPTNYPQITFDGSANATLRVTGVLPINHGGTGVNAFTANQVILSDSTNGTTNLVSRPYSDSLAAGALSSSSTNFVTERDIYFGLPTINNAHDYDSTSTIFAPTTGGNTQQILIANSATTAPVWANMALISNNSSANAAQSAITTLILGNNVAKSVASEHSEGQILLYSSGNYGHIIEGVENTTADYTHYLQNADGYILQSAYAGAVGSNTEPIFINAYGQAQALTYTANRLYYSNDTTNFIAGSYYADGSKLGINITAWPTDSSNNPLGDVLYVYGDTTITGITELANNVGIGTVPETGLGAHRLTVDGTTKLDGAVDITGITSITNSTSATTTTGALKVTGGILTNDNLVVTDTSELLSYVTIGAESDSNNTDYILTITGSTRIDSTNATLGYIEIETVNNVESLIFKPHTSGLGEIGISGARWKSAAFSEVVNLTHNNSIIELDVDGGNNEKGQITIATTIPTILLDVPSGADWILTNTAGEFSLNNQITNTITELKGTNKGFEITPCLYINDTIPNSNAYKLSIGGDTFSGGHIIPDGGKNLGSTTDRWAKLYVGTANTYGDAYLPVYWLDGVPTYLNGIVQYKSFTIASGTSSVILESPAYNQLNGVQTYVIQIVVTSGISYLKNPIEWTSAQLSGSTTIGKITLSTTDAVGGDVVGYILTVRGCEAPSST